MALHSDKTFSIVLESHLVAKLEDYAPNAPTIEAAIYQALNEFFTQRDKEREPLKP
jgi:hypothetical protein